MNVPDRYFTTTICKNTNKRTEHSTMEQRLTLLKKNSHCNKWQSWWHLCINSVLLIFKLETLLLGLNVSAHRPWSGRKENRTLAVKRGTTMSEWLDMSLSCSNYREWIPSETGIHKCWHSSASRVHPSSWVGAVCGQSPVATCQAYPNSSVSNHRTIGHLRPHHC